MVTKKDFYGAEEYILASDTLSVSVINYGATVKSIRFMGKELTLGYGTLQEYQKGTCYIGAVAGRYANRIAKGTFNINGKEYILDKNNGENHLHGGKCGFDKKMWDVAEITENSVLFVCFSPDGECGYPANLKAGVRYTVEGNRLRTDFYGETDADTYFAPTTHTYFNMGREDVKGIKLTVNASHYVPVDDGLIPTGELKKVDDTFDFRSGKVLGDVYYDHAFCLDGVDAFTAEWGGVKMSIETDYPYLQLYTGEFLKEGFAAGAGFAAEPEFCPDSPNQPFCQKPLLKKGEKYEKYAQYTFTLV